MALPEIFKTQVITVDAAHPDAGAIEEAASIIRRGRLVAFPTETVYGLGANARDSMAVSTIFVAKQRPSSNPLIVHTSSTEEAQALAARLKAVLDLQEKKQQKHKESKARAAAELEARQALIDKQV